VPGKASRFSHTAACFTFLQTSCLKSRQCPRQTSQNLSISPPTGDDPQRAYDFGEERHVQSICSLNNHSLSHYTGGFDHHATHSLHNGYCWLFIMNDNCFLSGCCHHFQNFLLIRFDIIPTAVESFLSRRAIQRKHWYTTLTSSFQLRNPS
jgi:hypothetical protein